MSDFPILSDFTVAYVTTRASPRQPLADRDPLESDPLNGEPPPFDCDDFDYDTAYMCLSSVRDELHELVNYPPRHPEFMLSHERDIRRLRADETLLAARVAVLQAPPDAAAPPSPRPDPSSFPPDQGRAITQRKKRRSRRK